jgi:uncharacterized RDD family membrane protein YckC
MKLKNFGRLRACSAFIDFVCFVIVSLITGEFADLLLKTVGENIVQPHRQGSLYYLGLTTVNLTFLLNKDLVNGQSIGKTLAGLRVVIVKNGKTPGPWRCLLRNLPTLLVPIEAVMLMIGYRRLGDYLAKTAVIESPDKYDLRAANWKLLFERLIIVMLTLGFTFCAMLIASGIFQEFYN